MSEVTPDDIRRIYEKLDGISASITRIEATCPACREEIGRNTRTLRGNGDGLVTRTSILEQMVGELIAVQKAADNNNPRLTLKQWAAIFAMIGAMGFFGSFGGNLLTGNGGKAAPPSANVPAEHDSR